MKSYGYTQARLMPAKQWVHLELFIATGHAFDVFGAASGVVKFPRHLETYAGWINRAAEDMIRCLGCHNDG